MKLLNNGDPIRNPSFLTISTFVIVSCVFFYLGMNWSNGYQQLVFYTSRQTPTASGAATIAISPNFNKTFDVSSVIANNQTIDAAPPSQDSIPAPAPAPSAFLAPGSIKTFGVVDENGTMAEEFEVGDYDPEVVENWGNGSDPEVVDSIGGSFRFGIKKFKMCREAMREYIPCLDNEKAIRNLKSTKNGEKFERHCPKKDQGLDCLVPAPKGYRTPIPWPKSRDEVLGSELLLIKYKKTKKHAILLHLCQTY